jgi:hypothetical protein
MRLGALQEFRKMLHEHFTRASQSTIASRNEGLESATA